jgi:hypothetical protein
LIVSLTRLAMRVVSAFAQAIVRLHPTSMSDNLAPLRAELSPEPARPGESTSAARRRVGPA